MWAQRGARAQGGPWGNHFHGHGGRVVLEEGRPPLPCPLGEGHHSASSRGGSRVKPGSEITQRWAPMASRLSPHLQQPLQDRKRGFAPLGTASRGHQDGLASEDSPTYTAAWVQSSGNTE